MRRQSVSFLIALPVAALLAAPTLRAAAAERKALWPRDDKI